MLKLENVVAHYGNIQALSGISLEVSEGEIATIIGANGAGKTTTLKTICSLISPTSGKIYFQGKDITGRPTYEIVEAGISMVPEGRRVFPRMTVLENLQLGAYLNKNRQQVKSYLEEVFTLFPVLKSRAKQVAGTLSGGEQQMLAIGRALMAKPKLLLLDEPSMGLAPKIVESIFDIITKINCEGTTILLVEQNAGMALSIANKGYVLETGKIVMSDTAENLLENEKVKTAYLGE
ncbi:ABC transporter ATP-binding protein [Tepidanaerobacter syntrophicus]|uniref:Branched-chain amino acid transport system ATP-binding protein n=1 Tax=Tepidanaerobacter syntrophicus TaxID=224999 RepID=A0A0U9HF47_9FIRM|nr:ABC transporter ATP-binding protein [Tepidanaerobacter syntrophicus]GAQ25390.1 branched-chain amino acid transport system ATP-binding protein [Tepidanaerobacter syntrophicus]GLI20181.1 ABC transporter ATP-binding protein [Tepidanaerobacter syntrophicus]GLI50948.1 ABC transporter ATP-binding protein [Tepidanaerobacter syntrophicus]HHV82733.1 ABC transporter ATP-binding protein [Tepidanaerobacter syntrophicus]